MSSAAEVSTRQVVRERSGGICEIFNPAVCRDDELHALIRALWGINLPRVKVCPEHVSPFEAVAHAYFAETPVTPSGTPPEARVSRLALAVLGLTKTFVLDADAPSSAGR
jgi:hypothetical protein